tara:strand:+ start:77 stop:274 length:198 start_codon:yes stop_codon:yes gene_type:complete
MPDATDLEILRITFYDYLEEYMGYITSGEDIPNGLARALLNTESDYEDMKEQLHGKDKNYYDETG